MVLLYCYGVAPVGYYITKSVSLMYIASPFPVDYHGANRHMVHRKKLHEAKSYG